MRRVTSWLVLSGAVLLPLAAAAETCTGTVYLTFDTGNMAQAETIARILKQEQVQATFFLANEKTFRGDHALDNSWRDYWRARVTEGHVFGNHTYRHIYARQDLANGRLLARVNYDGPEVRLDEQAFCDELRKVNARFQTLTGSHLSGLWRAPGGHTTRQTIRWSAGCGYPVHVHWDAAGFIGDELDSTQHPNEKLLKQALANIKPGTVTMMHLGIWSRREPLAPILEPLIQGLKAKGYCFAPLAAAGR
ncbi:MAG TPA: peptidase A8 [Gammaproteobacteria bacterium]|nr:peptidase A8 [Gammaproteobacteria bacterium]